MGFYTNVIYLLSDMSHPFTNQTKKIQNSFVISKDPCIANICCFTQMLPNHNICIVMPTSMAMVEY